MKYIIRIMTLPFILGMTIIASIAFIFRICKFFMLYGGEWTSYQKDDLKTIHEIYLKLKENNEG